MRVVAWLSWLVLLALAAFATAAATPFVRMLAVVAATMLGIKSIVLATARADGVRVPFANLGWFLLWFGMEPRQFVRRRAANAHSRAWVRRHARIGAANVLAGALLALAGGWWGGAAGVWVVVVACSVVLHFGLLTLLAALVRARGFMVPLLFDAPWRARTAAEFWGRRWNHGFAEMSAALVRRPLQGLLGARGALFAAFVWSGVLHELALSWPVRAGFGLPTLYFVVQGLVVLWQRERPSRAVVAVSLLLPLPLLFHPWFLDGVFAPWLRSAH